MRRTEVYIGTLVVALAGCMKIYPDPELPDLDVTWYSEDCASDAFQVQMSLTSLDNPSSPPVEKTVSCFDPKYTFVDVARERFRVDGTLLDDSGAMTGDPAMMEVDLRNGFDEEAFLFFGTIRNIQVEWTFDGTSCSELAADTVSLVFTTPMGVAFIISEACEAGSFQGQVMPGVYTLHAEALANDTVVATSPETPPLTIAKNAFFGGVLVLTACGAMCP